MKSRYSDGVVDLAMSKPVTRSSRSVRLKATSMPKPGALNDDFSSVNCSVTKSKMSEPALANSHSPRTPRLTRGRPSRKSGLDGAWKLPDGWGAGFCAAAGAGHETNEQGGADTHEKTTQTLAVVSHSYYLGKPAPAGEGPAMRQE